MPIHDNVSFLCNGAKDDAHKAIVLFTSPSLRFVRLHQVIGIISEVDEHAIFFYQESHIHLFLALVDRESRTHADKDLDIKLVGLQRWTIKSKKMI